MVDTKGATIIEVVANRLVVALDADTIEEAVIDTGTTTTEVEVDAVDVDVGDGMFSYHATYSKQYQKNSVTL
jgi:hypothetical protein